MLQTSQRPRRRRSSTSHSGWARCEKAALSAISSPQLVTKRDEQEAGAEALALARDPQLQASRVNRGREREVRGDLAKLCRVYNDERRADEKDKAVALHASELRIGETALQRMLAARADASLQPLVRAEHLEGECARVEEKLADLEEYAPRNSGAIFAMLSDRPTAAAGTARPSSTCTTGCAPPPTTTRRRRARSSFARSGWRARRRRRRSMRPRCSRALATPRSAAIACTSL